MVGLVLGSLMFSIRADLYNYTKHDQLGWERYFMFYFYEYPTDEQRGTCRVWVMGFLKPGGSIDLRVDPYVD
jgi:hypothetical protein